MVDPNASRPSAAPGFPDDRWVQKDLTEVIVRLANGKTMRGYFFLGAGERVVDALNDDRKFLPFMDAKEEIRLLNKARIDEVEPHD